MSLIHCPDCGREISSLAPAFIHCGRPGMQNAVTAVVSAPAACPLCRADVTHPNARAGGSVWCERCGGQLVYGPGGVLVRALPRAQQAAPVVFVPNQRSVGLAVLLAFFFGPLGMLYSTVSGALTMFLLTLFVAVPTFGAGLLLTWPAGVIWAARAATEHNRRLLYALPPGTHVS